MQLTITVPDCDDPAAAKFARAAITAALADPAFLDDVITYGAAILAIPDPVKRRETLEYAARILDRSRSPRRRTGSVRLHGE